MYLYILPLSIPILHCLPLSIYITECCIAFLDDVMHNRSRVCVCVCVCVCRALADANSALKIDILWPKGFYRRGRALAGLKVRPQ